MYTTNGEFLKNEEIENYNKILESCKDITEELEKLKKKDNKVSIIKTIIYSIVLFLTIITSVFIYRCFNYDFNYQEIYQEIHQNGNENVSNNFYERNDK